MATKKAAERYVVVTTDRRGVFVGRTSDSEPDEGGRITLTRARNVIYWSAETRGVFGIANPGLAPGSKVGPEVPRLVLLGVTSVADATPEAAAKWEAGPWG